ncbi:MAG TPA: DUF4262 domain-containing protein [Actinophytocola sp.]|uniref:DUF4262 domain-containing protein n=1 Tax=Actinophytocola sp. TaxID=1872138 RepID=UPI002DBCA810|nr:DUF4262 domain-containing protein [Actinophytocola sp.]HEU5472864.1 DUF4262 domain-containing protein [Actinophytocola sp.]
MAEELPEEQEALRRWLEGQAEQHGFATVEVGADEFGAGYVFSVGAWRGFGVPEAVIIGLPEGMGRMLLNTYLRRAREGERFALGKPYHDFFDNAPVVFERVTRGHYPEFFGSALLMYPNGDFPAVQLIVATPQGKWPWEADAPAGFADHQPVLTQSGTPESWIPGVDGP